MKTHEIAQGDNPLLLSHAAQAELGLVKDVSAGICFSRLLGSFIQLYKDERTQLMMIVIHDPAYKKLYGRNRRDPSPKDVRLDIETSPSCEQDPNVKDKAPQGSDDLVHDWKDASTPAIDRCNAAIEEQQLLTSPPGLTAPPKEGYSPLEARTLGRSSSPDNQSQN